MTTAPLGTIVADIATLYNATVNRETDTVIEFPAGHPVTTAFGIPGAMTLSFYELTERSNAGKMEVVAHPAGIPRPLSHGLLGDHVLPVAYMSMTRPVSSLVRDISTRILAKAASPINARVAKAKMDAEQARKLETSVHTIANAFPGMRVGPDGRFSYYERAGAGFLINGEIHGDKVYIREITDLTTDRFIAVMRVMLAPANADMTDSISEATGGKYS